MFSSLAFRGVAAAFFALLCFVFSSRAFAADWSVTYAYSPTSGLPASAVGLCAANDTVTKTKTVTVTATLTWTGSGTSPKRVKVAESALISWSAQLSRLQGGDDDGPPPSPNGV